MNRNLSLTLAAVLLFLVPCGAQTRDDIQLAGSFDGSTYKNSNLGLSYSYPDNLQPQSIATLPPPSDGRTHILLAMWDSPKQTPTPRIVMFVDDVSSYPNATTAAYLRSMMKAAQQAGAEASGTPSEVFISGLRFLRAEYRNAKTPEQVYNCGFVALLGKYALVFQINAGTQQQLEGYEKSVESFRISDSQARPNAH